MHPKIHFLADELIRISKEKSQRLWKVIYELVKIKTVVKSKAVQQEHDRLSDEYAVFVISAILFYRNASPVFRNIFVSLWLNNVKMMYDTLPHW